MIRCAIYTRKSHEEGLEQEFNSLDAQRLSAENYIKSQQHEGWQILPKQYDDGGFSGGTLERPALKELFEYIVYFKTPLKAILGDETTILDIPGYGMMNYFINV